MKATGTLSHIDISVGYPDKAIPFYNTLLLGLGYERMTTNHPGFTGANPERAWWSVNYPGGGRFGIELRPANRAKRDRRYDRYQPGPHHLAFHAASNAMVDAVYREMMHIGADVLDAPMDYSEQAGYSEGYYAVFFADPDGVKLEVVYLP